jgi:GTP-binding protein HflX
MLFATLDPTLRRVRLPHGTPIILSDTVGFISDLPTHLVAAFRATLEEVVEAELVLHVRDISDPDTAAQAADVEHILADLGIDADDESRVLEVWNKIDQVDPTDRERLLEDGSSHAHRQIAISAVTGEGVEALTRLIEAQLAGELVELRVTVAPDRLGEIDRLYASAEVLARQDLEDGGAAFTLRTTRMAAEEITSRLRTKPI